jgi:molybdopterin-binding protein
MPVAAAVLEGSPLPIRNRRRISSADFIRQNHPTLVAFALRSSSARLEYIFRDEGGKTMPLSARNHLKGEITEVLLGTVTALITVKVGDNLVESVITKRSAEELGLKKGDKVIAVIKATEVMIQKD